MEVSPISVGFPLRGEWSALNTPAHKVPSHGTDYMAQTYAYDFARLSWKDGKVDDFHGKKNIGYLLGRVKLHDCYGWSQPVIAPFANLPPVTFDVVPPTTAARTTLPGLKPALPM